MAAAYPATELQRAVTDAVSLVNAHSGNASIVLRFKDGELPEIDFVANSARIDGERFLFTAGFDEYTGSIHELASIKAHLIN